MIAKLLEHWQDPKKRKKAIRYWLKDPFWGVMDYIGHYGLRYLPIDISTQIAAFLGVIAGTYRFKKTNIRIKHNMAVLRPDLNGKAIEAMAKQMWQHLGQVMVEYSFFDKLHDEGRVILEKTENLPPVKTKPQPVIFITTHTGNWEICGNYVTEYGFDLMCLYKPVPNRFSRRIADVARARMGGVIKLVDADSPSAMRQICKHLTNNGAIWLAIDECKNNQVHGPRFGRDLATQDTNAAFAVRLAQRYAATVVPVLNKRHEKSRLTTEFGVPFSVEPSAVGAEAALLRMDKIIEDWVLANLEQWYMLHELRI